MVVSQFNSSAKVTSFQTFRVQRYIKSVNRHRFAKNISFILSKWNELFAWLPVETVEYENQQEHLGISA